MKAVMMRATVEPSINIIVNTVSPNELMEF